MTDDRQVAAALWWKQLKETNNDHFLPLFFDKHRYLILKGGGGSGKSIFAGRKVLERATTEPGHRVLVCRKVGKTIRESCFEQLKSQAYEYYADCVEFIPRGKGSDMYIKLKNGSEILFAGLDDVEKLKSIFDVTMLWIEEASELEEGDFNQLDIRLRTDFPFYLQMIVSFNPISITHWLKKRFFDRKDPRATVHESTYKDNRFLTKEAIETLEAFKETDEYYYMVYCLGQWGVTGKTVFNAKLVAERLAVIQGQGPVKRGFFAYTENVDGIHISNIHWVDDPGGPLKIYAEPGAGRPYVVGGDTAGDGSDWFIGQVLDNITGKQVATLRHQYDEDTYARQMYCLGQYYNNALLALETNFSTFPVKMLSLMGYRNLYVREVEDTYEGNLRHAFGFRTDQLTRPVIISELIRVLRENVHLLNDAETLQEMLTFVRNEKLRPEAESGAHDDCVMALAIAFYVRPQQSMAVKDPQSGNRKWSADQWEDYRNASQKDREIMVRMWGSPTG
ncbi:MAG: PBSX family phage terminase large subunit [Oscillospiraceae bacterium]|nr:PBSX family phage terminase large subunit [Oscillospiraceae bacterium]